MYGDPNAQWRLCEREDLDPDLPRPYQVNVGRDRGMDRRNWLYSAGIDCQIWLIHVANFRAVRAGLD